MERTKEFEEKIIKLNRVSKKTTGGNAISFSALVALGDRNGRFGFGLGKAKDVTSAIAKGVKVAQRNMQKVSIKNGTIAHEVRCKAGAAEVYLKPAPKGTGLIAGGVVRQLLELAGVKNISAKMFGSSNKQLNLQATSEALAKLKE
ncbi:MAG: 30S ribosomal protein S5 [Patescibacteria group bacterium]